jgi:4-carboxymuconolactone decarboxylase
MRVSVGAGRRARAQGAKADDLQSALAELDPQIAQWADDFVFGQVWAVESLTHEEQMLVAIVALAATGRSRQLKNYLHGAVQYGIDTEKLHEALRMLTVYCGFPIAIEALSELAGVRVSRERP